MEEQLNLFGSSIKNTQVEFGIISVKELPNLKLSLNQIKTVIESLVVYKEFIENGEAHEAKKSIELEKIIEILDFLQDIYKLNYKEACNRCINKRAKQKEDDPGIETFGWLNTSEKENGRHYGVLR